MIQNSYAPVLLFTYKRLDTLRRAVSALQQNYLAPQTELYIFSDGAKSTKDEQSVAEVRRYLHTIYGFRKVEIIKAQKNIGLANSIINGVTQIINKYGKVIVLEDDLVTSVNFLSFMNQCLEYYQNNEQVFSIAGYSFPLKKRAFRDVYFTKRGSSWGWATWQNRWSRVDWAVSDFESFKNNTERKKAFNKMGSDLFAMLERQMNGKLDSWAIRWCYQQFKEDAFTVYPTLSKVKNVGFDKSATNTVEYFNRFYTPLDQTGSQRFLLTAPSLDQSILKLFVSNFSVYTRIKYKLLNGIASSYRRVVHS